MQKNFYTNTIINQEKLQSLRGNFFRVPVMFSVGVIKH